MNTNENEVQIVPRLAIGLVHYPIIDRQKKIVATNVTNFDIHDIARAATVYGVEKYYIIHPMSEQLMFVDRILDHWRVGEGSKYNPYRRTALQNVLTSPSVDMAVRHWREECGATDCFTVATHARPVSGVRSYSFNALHEEIRRPEAKPCFLLFGTGFGLTEEFMQSCDGVLESIRGAPPKDYRHLSVRSAVSICLDRVMGPW
jgi:hypothetical protein